MSRDFTDAQWALIEPLLPKLPRRMATLGGIRGRS